jgi:hypothetical protein
MSFWADLLSNLIATLVGVFLGVVAALKADRDRHHTEATAAAARDLETRRAADALRAEKRKAVVALLVHSLDVNFDAMQYTEREVAAGRHTFDSGLELQTWDVLKSEVVEHVDLDVVARLAQHFTHLAVFDRMVVSRFPWSSEYEGSRALRDRIVQRGPQLRAVNTKLADDLRQLL